MRHLRIIRAGDKVMNKRLVKLEARIVREIATPKHKYFRLGKLSIHYRKRRRLPYIIEGKFHPENYNKTFTPKITIMWCGKHGFIRTIQLRKH